METYQRQATERRQTQCCIAGGGPAGVMLGLLLARAGVDVVVLEKHRDFLRDFRGDTIHPSTLEILYELGLLQGFLKRPHQEVEELRAQVGELEVPLADFRHLPTHCRFLALMPQWDFLDLLAERARSYPNFELRMEAEVVDLIRDAGTVVGVRAHTPDGPLEVRAALTVGADGRDSSVRAHSGLSVRELGAPIDVLWMRLSRRESDPTTPIGRVDRGSFVVMIYRGRYWQCGLVIPKGEGAEIRKRGIEAFRRQMADAAPLLRDRVAELESWEDVKLLTVKVDRLERWYRSGLLCIGDAAHAMSPVGGVGINLAIQDAVAAANALAEPLALGKVSEAQLRRVQRRRSPTVVLVQALQVFLQDHLIVPSLAAKRSSTAPWPLWLFGHWPALRRIPARLIGVGLWPEHVRSVAAVRDDGRLEALAAV